MRTHRQAGFTLVEMLIVTGLILMTVSLVVANFDRLALAMESKPVHQVFRAVAAEARYQAAAQSRTVYLTWDAENVRFRLNTDEAQPKETEDASFFDEEPEVDPEQAELEANLEEIHENIDANTETQILFYRLLSTESAKDSADENRYADEPVERLRFEPNGVATPALIIIRNNEFEEEITLDAFSSGPIQIPFEE